VWVQVVLTQTVLVAELLGQDLALGLSRRVGIDALGPHEVQQLARQLGKGFLGKQHGVVFELAEGNELHNISIHVPLVALTEEGYLISIQLVHGCKVSIAYAYNNDTKGQARTTHNLVNGSLHVIDHTVCDDKQNIVFLVVLGALQRLSLIVNQFQDATEVSWAIQIRAIDCVLVGIHNATNAVTLRVEDVTI